MDYIAISKVRPNSENPRYIKDEKFKKLVQSIKEFPEMMPVRPIVVNKEMVVLGGNMRLKAMQEAGLDKVWVEVVDWPEEKQREFIIKDNVGFGEWDWDELANTWGTEELKDWGLDVWQPEEEVDYSGANQEIDVDNLDGLMTIKLNYTEEDYWKVKEALSKVAETPEQSVYKLLNL